MKWHVFKKDDPNTWPELDCPIVTYKENEDDFDGMMFLICKWSPTLKTFVEYYDGYIMPYEFDECFYSYIGYVPAHKSYPQQKAHTP